MRRVFATHQLYGRVALVNIARGAFARPRTWNGRIITPVTRSASLHTTSSLLALALLLSSCATPNPDATPTVSQPTLGVTFVPPGTKEAPTAPPTSATTPTPAPSATPRPLNAPVLVDRAPVRGEALDPAAPLALTFDQPMDHASVEKALVINATDGAAIQGKIEWQGDNALRFTPVTPWDRAARYTVALNATARSAKGIALARPEAFTVNTIGTLAVAQTLPADGAQDVAPDSAITVLFNRPVVPLTALAQQAALSVPVTFEPAIAGAGQWLNTSIYVFTPAQPLAAGTTYKGVIAAGLKDTAGALLDTAVIFSFTAAPPAVRAILPAANTTGVDLRAPISVTFSQPMDHASAEAAFVLAPETPGTFTWAAEPADDNTQQPPQPLTAAMRAAQAFRARGEVLGFTPDATYARDTDFSVTVRAGAKAANGAATATDFRARFRTIPVPAVISTEPANAEGAAETGSFAIRFTAPVSPDLIMRNLTFTPALSLSNVYSYFDTYSNKFNLNLQFKPSTTYRVHIGEGIKDDYGAALAKAVDLKFTTRALQPFVGFEADGLVGTFNASAPTTVYATSRNVTEINLELARLTLQNFHSFVGAQDSFDKLKNFKPAKDQLVRQWKRITKAALNETGLDPLLLDADGGTLEPGIYLLSASAPEVSALDPNAPPTRLILVVSARHLTLKRAEQNALVWVTDLNSGQPVAGAPVALHSFGQKFEPLGDAAAEPIVTEAGAQAGQALIPLPAAADRPASGLADPLLAVVDEGGPGFGLVWSDAAQGINTYEFNLPTRYTADPYFSYLYTDRPIYRPGQMVFLKGIVRRDNDARYAVDAQINTLRPQLTVSSPQGQAIYSQTVVLNANGTFSAQIALDNVASSGYYYAQLCVPGAGPAACSYGSVNFIVSAYRRPEFEVALSAGAADIAAGGTFNAALSAKYFFGGNVAGAKVNWSLLAQDWRFDRYQGPGNFAFGDFDHDLRGPGYSDQIASGEGQTDASGMLTITVPADLSTRPGSARYTLQTVVTDKNDQAVSASAESIVHKGALYTGVAPRNYVALTGEAQTLDVLTVDWQGAPVADKPGAVQILRREWFTTQAVDAQGYREYTSVPSDTLITTLPFTSAADGTASVEFTPDTGGEYRIVAGADTGVAGAASIYVSEQGEYVAWRVENNDRIALKTDKPAYKPGETAHILVPSPFQGPVQALLTLERGGFLERKTIQLNSNSDVLDIPVDAAYAPNVYVSVLLVAGVDAVNKVPAFKLGYTQFSVDPAQFALNIAIATDKPQYSPRDQVTYDITVTGADGAPVQAELSLALVDKAVLSLTDPNSIPLIDAFYGLRALSVRTADSLVVNVDRRNLANAKALGAKGGGGGGGGPGSADGLFIRQNFKDTAHWSAVIETDAEGKAHITVPLPDNLTTWTLDARAVTADTRVGQAVNEIISTKPLLIRPVTPRFLVVGDQVTLAAVVNNNSSSALETMVALDATGVVLKSDATHALNVPARGSARVEWQAQALDTGAAALTFTVRAGVLQDSSTPGLSAAGIPILNYLAPETVATAGDVSEPGAKIELIALPARLDTGHGRLDVHVDTGLGAAALRAQRRIADEPYQSVEWAASQLLSSVALDQTGPAPELRAAAERALQRLFNEQLPDGGWSWWTTDTSNPFLTAHAILAIGRARAAGFAFDQSALERARDFLAADLSKPAGELDAAGANRRAYALHALGEAGLGDTGRLGALYESRDKLGHYGKALLALSLAEIDPADARVKTLQADVLGSVVTSATSAHWQEAARDDENIYGETRSTSIALLMLARLDPSNPLASNGARWLMSARNDAWWTSAHESAWATVALSEWLRASGESAPTYAWRAALNDTPLLAGDEKASASTDISETASVDAGALLRERANTLVFERGAGDGRLYYTARLQSYLPVEQARAIDRGMVIARKYELASCLPTPAEPCAAIDSATIGEIVRVRLTLVAPATLNYVRISDPLPAGMEAIDTSLKTSQTLNKPGLEQPAFGGRTGWGWWWFGHTDVQDDHVAVFASQLPAGAYEYTYEIRPSIAGVFKVMPSAAEQQYFPEVFGRGDGMVFTVTR